MVRVVCPSLRSGFSPVNLHKGKEGVGEDVEGEGSEANPLHG